jgi:hypothetical protein
LTVLDLPILQKHNFFHQLKTVLSKLNKQPFIVNINIFKGKNSPLEKVYDYAI